MVKKVVMLQGFREVSKEVPRRLIMSARGREKCGKTTLALTAPGPIAYFSLDTGDEGVVEKWASRKTILKRDWEYRDATQPNEWLQMWEEFKASHNAALKHPDVRTIIWDTATEAWELIRLAKFGKLLQVMPHQYAPVNAEFRDLIRRAFNTTKNFVMLHKLKAEYINNNKTGNLERAGFGDAEYIAQINVLCWWDREEGFGATIDNCRQNMDLAGVDIGGEMCNFASIGTLVFPDTKEREWE